MHRKDLICEMKTIFTKEMSEIKQQYDQELDEMKGKIHVLEVENDLFVIRSTSCGASGKQ